MAYPFSTLNDPLRQSHVFVASSSAEHARLKTLADALASPAPLILIDNDNHFRLDCRVQTVNGIEKRFLTRFLPTKPSFSPHGALRLPVTVPCRSFMRAYRRFGPRELENVIAWIESISLGRGVTNGGNLWAGAREFRSQMVDVMEWSTSSAVQDVDAVYRGLQEYGLRIAVSAVASYPVAMETIRLIDLDDRSLLNLTPAEIKESVSNSGHLSSIDAYASMEECIEVRSELFNLSSGDE